MTTVKKLRFRAVRPHWPQAWVTLGLAAITAGFVAVADGIQNWSVFVVYGIAAVSLFLSIQPWRSFLELDHRGFRLAWGAQCTAIRWCDVTSLRPVPQQGSRYGGVAFTAEARTHSLLGLLGMRRKMVVSGTIDAMYYGINDGQLYQLMTHLRGCVVDDMRAQATAAETAAHPRKAAAVPHQHPLVNN